MTDQNPTLPPAGGEYPANPVYQAPYPAGYEQVSQQPLPEGYDQSAQAAYPDGYDQSAQAAYPAGYDQSGQAGYPAGYDQSGQAAYPAGYDQSGQQAQYQAEGYPAPTPKKKGKAWVVLILLLALLLLGGGATAAYFFVIKKDNKAQPSPTQSPTAPPTRATNRPTGPPVSGGGQAYTSPLGFAVTIPQGWTSKLESNQETFSNNAQDEKFAFVVVVDHGVKAISEEAFMNDLVKKTQTFPETGYSLEQPPQKVSFGSVPAVRARFGSKQNGYQVVHEIYVIKGADGRLYQIQFEGSFEYFPSHLQDFNQFQSTFRLTGASPAA